MLELGCQLSNLLVVLHRRDERWAVLGEQRFREFQFNLPKINLPKTLNQLTKYIEYQSTIYQPFQQAKYETLADSVPRLLHTNA